VDYQKVASRTSAKGRKTMTTETKKVEIQIHLNDGSDQGYFRPYNDPEKGSITNVGTWNSSYTAIRGADPSGPRSDWFDLSEKQLVACNAIAQELGTDKVNVFRVVGSFRTVYTAQTYKFGANGRYYVIECEIGE
jgi:hypothetical protein